MSGPEVPDTMQAAVQQAFGLSKKTLSVLNVPVPTVYPKSNNVLVRVHAASLNPLDYKLGRGDFKLVMGRAFPHPLGSDVSGTVVVAGSNCKRLKVGDEVFGNIVDRGSLAEYCMAPENYLAMKPANVSFEDAATLGIAGVTAYKTLTNYLEVKSGQKVLILGGSGGVGTIAIQIAKSIGCYVCTTSTNGELVLGLGVDRVINYKNEKWWEVLAGDQYDAILDCVGEGWEHAEKVITKKGRFCTIVGDSWDLPLTIGTLAKMSGAMIYRRLGWVVGAMPYHATYMDKPGNPKDLEEVIALVAEGKVRAVVDASSPYSLNLEDVLRMFEVQMSRKAKGKLIMKMV